MASQSGGGVRIDSVLGRGTTVTVFLPRAAANPVPVARGAGAEQGSSYCTARSPEPQDS
jgi:hypothetical protein